MPRTTRLIIIIIISDFAATSSGFILFLSKCDLVEDELGNWVRECWGYGKEIRFGLVSSLGIGNVAEFEFLTIREGEFHSSLLFDSSSRAWTGSRLGDDGAISSFDLGPEFANIARIDAGVTENWDFGSRRPGGSSWVAVVGASDGDSQKASEQNLMERKAWVFLEWSWRK